jgi:GH25 family lysozyme M1 (1,4-beta-N-acetylmuramidase)
MGSQLPSWAQKERALKIPNPPPPHGALVTILGVDISEWQGGTNLAAYDRSFIIIREQYGTAGLDKQFVSNRNQARSRNLPRSFYHYAYPEYNTPESEARTFAYGTDWQPGEGAMLDFEEQYGDPVGWSLRFLQTFESIEHFKPTIYMNVYTLYAYNWAPVAANGNGLIAAQWNFNQSTPPSGAFPFAAGKQYTDADSVNGISGRVDGDVFYGDASTFLKYGAGAGAGAGTNPPPPAPAPTPAPGIGCSHTVQPGETLSGLVGSRWPQVAAGNGLSNPNLIRVGQVLNLCASGSAVSSGSAAGCVTVRRGDTMSGLFGANWPAVARKNGIRNPNLIFPGERICA